MLIPKNCVIEAMDLTTEGVKKTLRENGYEVDTITSSEYLGMNTDGNFVYNITYPDEISGSETTSNIYVYIHYNELTGVFGFFADN